MDAWVITLIGDEYSERMADRCIASANIPVRKFPACRGDVAQHVLHAMGLRWSWGEGFKHLQHKPYGGDLNRRIACFLSHYTLWQICIKSDQPMLILEHDALFVRPFVPFSFKAACMINDPAGATPRGDCWRFMMTDRGPGTWPKTPIFDDSRPDGLAGNSAYVIQPHCALWLVNLAHWVGAWPNDALMCRQLVDGLEEHYPFITEVHDERSTIRL